MKQANFLSISFYCLVGIICSILASIFIKKPSFAEWLWLSGMCSVLIGLILNSNILFSNHIHKKIFLNKKDAFILIILFSISLITRIIALQYSPLFIHGDEAACGLYGRLFNSGQAPLLSIGWYGLPMFSYAISGIGIRLFGDTIVGLRLINTIIGSFCIILVYLLGKELFTRKVGIISAFLLSFSFLLIDLSRDGIHYIQGPTCILLTIYLCVKSQKTKSALLAFLVGISFIIDLQVYWSARIALILAPILFLLIYIYNKHLLRNYVQIIGWIIFGVLISGLPIFSLFATNPGSFNSRQNEVYIFNGTNGMKNHLLSVYKTSDDYKTILIQQTIRTLMTFINRGDASSQIGWTKGIIDPITTILFGLALLYALLNAWKKWQYLFCILWILLVIAAGIFTVDPPWWPRLVVLLPPIMILIGNFLSWILQIYNTRTYKIFTIAGVSLLLLSIAMYNLHVTFVDYPIAIEQKVMQSTLIGNFLANNQHAENTVFISSGELFLNYETIRFLAPNAAGCTVTDDNIIKQCPNSKTSKLFIILPSRINVLTYLKQIFPGGKVTEIGPGNYINHAVAYERL